MADCSFAFVAASWMPALPLGRRKKPISHFWPHYRAHCGVAPRLCGSPHGAQSALHCASRQRTQKWPIGYFRLPNAPIRSNPAG